MRRRAISRAHRGSIVRSRSPCRTQHGRANLGELVANHCAEAAELVDAARRPHAVAVQLLDRVGMPEIDVVTGVMPADHALDHRQQRWQRPAQPDRRGEAWPRHGRDGRALRGGARACRPSTGRRPQPRRTPWRDRRTLPAHTPPSPASASAPAPVASCRGLEAPVHGTGTRAAASTSPRRRSSGGVPANPWMSRAPRASLAETPGTHDLRDRTGRSVRAVTLRVYGSPSLRSVLPSPAMGEEVMRQALETVVSGRAPRHRDRPRRDGHDDGGRGDARPRSERWSPRLRTKGETRRRARRHGRVDARACDPRATLGVDAVDTCGTGGDGAGTFNISTRRGARRGGRRVSGRQARQPRRVVTMRQRRRARSPRCRHLAAARRRSPVRRRGGNRLSLRAGLSSRRCATSIPVRRELGIRTVFNVLGPLANPARVRHQLVGVSNARLAPMMAEVLHRLGHVHALVFTGPDGIDELGVGGPAQCYEVTPRGHSRFRPRSRGRGCRRGAARRRARW